MNHTKLSRILLCGVATLVLLNACNLTPQRDLPAVANPAQFKEDTQKLAGNFGPASTNAGQVDDTDWWAIFGDATLNELEAQATANNQTLQAASARIEQADATYRQARAGLFPSVGLGANAGRGNFPSSGKPATNFMIQANLAYEVDLFGRIRNQRDIAQLNAEAQRDTYNQSLLLIHAQVAQTYFLLQSLDTERDLLRQTIQLRENALKLIKTRFDLGETGEQDYLRSQNELATAQADLTALDRQRSIAEHALSILVGKAPADFNLSHGKLPGELPLIPAGLPSSVLQRRPDIAAAQKQLAAANAQIGIARAAFFPVLNLTSQGGLVSNDIGDLFKWSSTSWTLGPLFGTALSMPVFDAGRRLAGVDLAKAGYEERVATYRQQVLVAFGEVEDALVSLHTGADQADQLYRAAEASTKANHLSDLRYKEGEASYLEVIDTQRDALNAQRAYTRVQGQRFIDTVTLIRALGGGWGQLAQAAPITTSPQPTKTDTPVVKPVVPADQGTAPAPELQANTATPQQPAIATPTATPQAAPVLPAESSSAPAPAAAVTPQPAPAYDGMTTAPLLPPRQGARTPLPLNQLAPLRQ